MLPVPTRHHCGRSADRSGLRQPGSRQRVGRRDCHERPIYGGKGNDVLSVAGNFVGGNVEGNSGADTITVAGTASAALAAGGKGNDTISLAAVDGGQVGGQLGADTMVVGGVLKNALVSMTNVGDPENSADLADSLTVGSSVSNSTVYSGAGADFMSVAGAMIAGEVYAGSGNDSVILGGSLWCRHLGSGSGFWWLRSKCCNCYGRNGERHVQLAGAVRDSSLVGGFGADSITATGQLRGSTVWGGDLSEGGSPIDGADYVSVASASAVYGNSGADSLFVGGSATATSLYGGTDNDLVSISGDLSAGEIIGGSGADSVIITGSLMGSATVTLDSSSSTEKRTTASPLDSLVLVLRMATRATTPLLFRVMP